MKTSLKLIPEYNVFQYKIISTFVIIPGSACFLKLNYTKMWLKNIYQYFRLRRFR